MWQSDLLRLLLFSFLFLFFFFFLHLTLNNVGIYGQTTLYAIDRALLGLSTHLSIYLSLLALYTMCSLELGTDKKKKDNATHAEYVRYNRRGRRAKRAEGRVGHSRTFILLIETIK